MISCPNKSSKIWKDLVAKYGEDKAYIYMNMPNPDVVVTDYGYRIDDTLLIDVSSLDVDKPVSNLIPLLTEIVDIIDYDDLDIKENNNPFISDDKIAFTDKAVQEDNEEVKKLLNTSSLSISIRDWMEDNSLETLFKLNNKFTYITDKDEIYKILLENNIVTDNKEMAVYNEIYDMFDSKKSVSFEKRKSEWLLDIIDNDTNERNKEIAILLLKKLNHIYDVKVNSDEETSYPDSINIQEANSLMFLQEFLSNLLGHIFKNNNLNKVEISFLNDMKLLYNQYHNDSNEDLDNVKTFVIDTLLDTNLQSNTSDELAVENKLYKTANKLLEYEINNKSDILNTTLSYILKYLDNDKLFEHIHKNKEIVKIQKQVNDTNTTKDILKFMELNNITTYTDNVFDMYVKSLSAREQKQLYSLLNSENRYSDRANLNPILNSLKKTYNKLKLVKTIERRLNGNVAKIVANTNINVQFNPESNTLVFNNQKYIFSIKDNIIQLYGKDTPQTQDLIDYLKTYFKLNLSFNGEVVVDNNKFMSDLDKKIQDKLKELTKTPESEIIEQCSL